MKSNHFIPLLFLLLILTGCGNSGAFLASNSTEVQLKEGNYKIVAVSVTGSAETSYLIGASHSWGLATQSFGLIPLEGSKTIYKDAREDLWNSYREQYSPVKGRKLALVNIKHDAATVNYLIYTKAKVTITADVIECD